jgi:NADP-dependent 3-hydroxy acid dehydrogenase YdfG
MSFEQWQKHTGVTLGGAFLFTKYVAILMIARGTGGNIINIISTAGHQGEPGNIAYSTSKCGLMNFTPLCSDGARQLSYPRRQPGILAPTPRRSSHPNPGRGCDGLFTEAKTTSAAGAADISRAS